MTPRDPMCDVHHVTEGSEIIIYLWTHSAEPQGEAPTGYLCPDLRVSPTDIKSGVLNWLIKKTTPLSSQRFTYLLGIEISVKCSGNPQHDSTI